MSEDIQDITRQRTRLCRSLNLNHIQYSNLIRIRTLPEKITGLLNQIEDLKEELAVERSKTKSPNVFQRMSVAKLDPDTDKIIEKYVSLTEACAAFGKQARALSEYFRMGDTYWMGFKWKKIELQKRCNSCGKLQPQAKFPKNGITEGIQRYKSHCHKCHAKKAREIRKVKK